MKRTIRLCVLPLFCLAAVLAFTPLQSFAADKAQTKKPAAAAKSTATKSTATKKAAPKKTTVKKPTPATKKTATKKAAPKKKKKKTAQASKKEAENPQKPDVPVEQPEIPLAIVDAIASGDVNGAIILMREEKANPKLLYLTREATRVANFRVTKKPGKSEAHKFYQNAAISHHNLYLFLKARGIDQREYLKDALDLYGKARKAATLLHKAECDLLQAALMASSGDLEKAEKKYAKINDGALRGDFESMEYLAAYHAATGNVEGAMAALDAAHRLSPEATLVWLAVGDDFANVADDPRFKALMISWKAREASEKLTLKLPKAEKPRLQMTDDTGLFRPQKAMPHYNLKKKAPAKKSAVTKKSAKKTTSTKKKPTAKAGAKKTTR